MSNKTIIYRCFDMLGLMHAALFVLISKQRFIVELTVDKLCEMEILIIVLTIIVVIKQS